MYYERVFNKVNHLDKRTGKTYTAYFSYSKELPFFKTLYSEWYLPKKIVPKNHLMNLDALGVAVWYMDDGWKSKCGYYIATMCFSDDDLQLIKNYFKTKWDIEITYCKNKCLYIHAADRNKFTKIIKPYIHSDCNYKIFKESL